MTGLRWSRRTTTTISEELAALGISVSPNTVARLLYQMGYSLRVNHKQIATTISPDRNLQFEYLADLRDRFQRRHLPIVSVDSKKRELVGNFKNPGRRWECAPRRVYDHDFRTDSSGVPFLMEFTMSTKIVVLWWSASPRYSHLRGARHRSLVATRGFPALFRLTPTAHPGGYRR